MGARVGVSFRADTQLLSDRARVDTCLTSATWLYRQQDFEKIICHSMN